MLRRHLSYIFGCVILFGSIAYTIFTYYLFSYHDFVRILMLLASVATLTVGAFLGWVVKTKGRDRSTDKVGPIMVLISLILSAGLFVVLFFITWSFYDNLSITWVELTGQIGNLDLIISFLLGGLLTALFSSSQGDPE
ncbi:MAG: hypothetical protein RIM33_17555 [Alphaproteobacteria bacterium]